MASFAPRRPAHPPFRRLFRRPHRRIAALVGLGYLFVSMVVFRDVIFAIPAVFRGERVIVGDELVPFFNPDSQYQSQARGEFNELTHGFEFRVRYSYLTSWVRYYLVLPFALIIMPPVTAWISYLSTSWFVSKAFGFDRRSVYMVAAGPVGLLYLIMTYAKVTHFYTLILGLSLMTASAMLMLAALLFEKERPFRLMLFACIIALFNPAVHYLVLFTLFFAITCIVLVLSDLKRIAWELFAKRRTPEQAGPGAPTRRRGLHFGNPVAMLWTALTTKLIGRCILASAVLVVVTLVPYAMFVKFVALRGVELSQTVPSDFYFIQDASVPLQHVLSFDLAGIMDKIQFGDYLAKQPRSINMIYSVLLFAPLLMPRLRRTTFTTRPRRLVMRALYTNIIFGMWASIGYADPEWFPTFHRLLSSTTRTLYATNTPVGELTLALASTTVQVLRFPHRFQLIVFAVGPLLITLTILPMIEPVRRYVKTFGVVRRNRGRRLGRWAQMKPTAIAILIVLLLMPLFANAPYRNVFTSGDFGDLASAFPVGQLEEVRLVLADLPEGKTVVLPPVETSKVTRDAEGVDHKFIDKFFIYYLDEPSYYYGLTGDVSNKFEFFLLLRALYYEEDWWINIARDIDLRYIVINKQLVTNGGVGAEYLPGIELVIKPQIERLDHYVEKIFENDAYALYEITDPPNEQRDRLVIDAGWTDFLAAVYNNLDVSRCWNLEYMTSSPFDWTSDEEIFLLTDDVDAAALDLYVKRNPTQFTAPSPAMFAFNEDIISSSYYLSPMFRLYLFFSATKWNRTNMIIPGIFGTVNGGFIGLPRATTFHIPAKVSEPGRYRMLLRASTTSNEIVVDAPTLGLRNQTVSLRAGERATQFFTLDEIYERDRRPLDVDSMAHEEISELLDDDVIPVSIRFEFHDLGVVDAPAGVHRLAFDKLDDNQMLVEGLVLIPEAEYQELDLGATVTAIDPEDSSILQSTGCADEQRETLDRPTAPVRPFLGGVAVPAS